MANLSKEFNKKFSNSSLVLKDDITEVNFSDYKETLWEEIKSFIRQREKELVTEVIIKQRKELSVKWETAIMYSEVDERTLNKKTMLNHFKLYKGTIK